MTAAWRHRVRTFALWLSLAVVLTCSLGSFGSPAEASSGSAFNAFTSDVSLGPVRAGEPEKQRREQTPPGGAGQAKALPATVVAFVPPPPATPKVYTGYSVRAPAAIAVGTLGARAPPLS